MKSKVYLLIALATLTMASCVSVKKLDAEKAKYNELSGNYLALQAKYRDLQDELKKCNNQVDKNNSMIAGMNETKAGLEAMTVSINNRLITNLLNRTLQDGYTFSERVWQTGADYQVQIKRLLASGIAQGRGTAKIARDLGDYVKKGRAALPKGYTEAKFGDVVVKNVDYRALRVVRTELGTSMQEASIEQSWSNPAATQLFNWVRINTQIHECVCPDLAAGSPYKAPGAPLDRPDVPGRPHPNCMCQVRPILADLDTVAADIARWHNGEQVEYLDSWYARYRRTA